MKPIVLKKYRMMLVASMIILLPASGVLWALADSPLVLALCILVSSLAILAALGEEVASTAILDEVTRLEAEVEKQGERIRTLDETIREEDRILAMLEAQNSRVSAELLAKSFHSDAA